MKTTRLISIALLSVLGLMANHPNSLPDDLISTHPTLCPEAMPAASVIGGWYLIMDTCPGTETMICCCSDGNGYICSGSALYFYCKWGGPFDCTAGLGDCEENPSNCDSCCPGGRC